MLVGFHQLNRNGIVGRYTERVNTLTVFGLIAISTMLIAYALEERSRAFVLLFAAACAGSSVYGFLAGTWPFGMVEAVWTTVALRRWTRRKVT